MVWTKARSTWSHKWQGGKTLTVQVGWFVWSQLGPQEWTQDAATGDPTRKDQEAEGLRGLRLSLTGRQEEQGERTLELNIVKYVIQPKTGPASQDKLSPIRLRMSPSGRHSTDSPQSLPSLMTLLLHFASVFFLLNQPFVFSHLFQMMGNAPWTLKGEMEIFYDWVDFVSLTFWFTVSGRSRTMAASFV